MSFNCSSQKNEVFQPKEVYKSKKLTITQIAKQSFVHTSFKQTNDFGNVPCNGLIVTNKKEAIVFDTPTNNENAEELIKWITTKLQCKIKAIIPTHFHDDCLGGLQSFDDHDIPSYAYFKTTELAKANNFTVPKNNFQDSISFKFGEGRAIVKFFGEGHTKDNVIGYYANDNIIFGGCLIKELNAEKGYLGDANVTLWSSTVQKIKKEYPDVKIVVPGHGAYGDKSLLDYTIKLFEHP